MRSPLAWGVVAWLALIGSVLIVIAAIRVNRAADPSLLVRSAYPSESRMYAPCPRSPRQIPRKIEREA